MAAAVGIVFIGWGQYYQSRFDIRKEYALVEQGLDFGNFLNEVEPRPSIGVGPAGGIALSYDGYIYDLLGLNWVEMAHANPVKTGMRNHASLTKPLSGNMHLMCLQPSIVPALPTNGLPFGLMQIQPLMGFTPTLIFRNRMCQSPFEMTRIVGQLSHNTPGWKRRSTEKTSLCMTGLM